MAKLHTVRPHGKNIGYTSRDLLKQGRTYKFVRLLCALLIVAAIPSAGLAQEPVVAMDATEKLSLHWNNTVSPLALVGVLGYAGLLQEMDSPREWRQGWDAYGKRVGSSLGASVIHSGLAFGLDTALHQDPRYFRAKKGNWLKRAGHAVRGTILTKTDSGSETFSTWRVGSAYGSAFLSNLWYPKRLDTFELGVGQGSITLGFDLVKNLATEFWPDLKRKLSPSK